MVALSTYILTEPVQVQNRGGKGTFGIVNRDPTATIYLEVESVNGKIEGLAGGITLAHQGDSISLPREAIESYTLSASAYPALILYVDTPLALNLEAAPTVVLASPNPSGGSFHQDLTVAAAGAGISNIWTPATGNRVVINSLFVSADSAMRAAVVDNADTAGNRLVAPYLAANASIGRAYTGDPWKSAAVGNVLKLAYSAAGNVFVSLDGFEQVG